MRRLLLLVTLAPFACDSGQKPAPPNASAPPPSVPRDASVDAAVDASTVPQSCDFVGIAENTTEGCDAAACQKIRGANDPACKGPFHCLVVRDRRGSVRKTCGAEAIDCLETEHLVASLGGAVLERCDGLAVPVPKEPPHRFLRWCNPAHPDYWCTATRQECEHVEPGEKRITCVHSATVYCYVQTNPGLVREHVCFAAQRQCEADRQSSIRTAGENLVLSTCAGG